MYPEDEDNEFSRADLLNFLGEFISQNRNAETLYRNHLCGVIVSRIFDEFGPEGLCELMMQIDIKAGWISDIIFESSDFNNAMFKRHGIYDEKIVNKARSTDSLNELNQKIWRLRKKYANIIADEIALKDSDVTTRTDSGDETNTGE
jgi:hypothetical protein